MGLALTPKLLSHTPGQPCLSLDVEKGLVPHAAIAFLDAHGLRERLYHDMEVGSYLTWDEAAAGKKVHPVFQDPRINGYPPDFHAVLRRDDLGADAWQGFLSRWDITAALLTFPDENPRLAWFPAARWALVFRDAEALVFVRRDRLEGTELAALELPLTFVTSPDDPERRTRPRLLDTRPSTLAPCLWHQRRGDHALEQSDADAAHASYGAALASLDEPGPACPLSQDGRDALRRTAALLALQAQAPDEALTALGPLHDDDAETTRGLAWSAQGRWLDAEASFAAVLARTPDRPDALFGSAMAREALGRADDANERFRELLRVAPSHPGAAHARRALGLR